MGKQYGERSKDDLQNEVDALQAQIRYYEEESNSTNVRVTALSYARDAHSSVPTDVETLLQTASKIEKYLTDGTVPSNDPTPGPDVPVPSPS